MTLVPVEAARSIRSAAAEDNDVDKQGLFVIKSPVFVLYGGF